MRDRLIELIDEAINDEYTSYSNIADYLLANGVIVPPCKVGDKVYAIFEDKIRELKVISHTSLVSETVKTMTIHCTNYRGAGRAFEWCDIGKTVFLTREEAEKSLKGEKE